jgi:4-amino-4-deoxy-L-arabinose transferase-like glycosyltransferase
MKQSQQLLTLLVICICTFFVHLEAAFPDIMEMRNFTTAREMIAEGNWWFTTLNLEPRLEKPPLPTWITAWSVLAFGDFDNLYALRFPGAIMSTLMIFFFYGFVKEQTSEKYLPFVAASVLATSLLIVQMGRTNSWDVYTHAFMVGSLWQFMVGINRKKSAPIIYSMLFMGLSVFSKGPVSLYALWLPFVIAFGVGFGGKELIKHWKKLTFILIGGLIIGFAWNIYMYLNQPEVTEFVLNKETTSWGSRHVKSILFYLNFPIFIGIWIPFLVAFFFYKLAKPLVNKIGNYKFALAWVVATIILLSVIPTKKERYLLPALIPMAFAVSYLVYGMYRKVKNNALSKYEQLVVKLFVYILSGLTLIGSIVTIILFKETIDSVTIITFAVVVFLGIIGIKFLRHSNYEKLFFIPIGMVCVICLGATPKLVQWAYGYDEFKSLAEIQKIEELKGLPIYIESQELDPKIVWLAGKPTKSMNSISYLDKSNFPSVAITINPIWETYVKEDLDSVNVKPYGVFDFFRKDSKWKTSVYLVEWKE